MSDQQDRELDRLVAQGDTEAQIRATVAAHRRGEITKPHCDLVLLVLENRELLERFDAYCDDLVAQGTCMHPAWFDGPILYQESDVITEDEFQAVVDLNWEFDRLRTLSDESMKSLWRAQALQAVDGYLEAWSKAALMERGPGKLPA